MPVFRKLHTGIGVASIKNNIVPPRKNGFFCLVFPSVTAYLFFLGGILPPNPHEKKKNKKSCRLSKKT